MVYLKYEWSKLKGLLFLFCLPLLSILLLKTKRNDLARPVMGTIFLVNIAYYTSRSGIWLVISRLASYFYEPEATANTA